MRESEARYRLLFEASPVPIWEQDFSAVASRFDDLRATGVVDFRKHLAADHAEVRRLAAMVRISDVNAAAVALFNAADKRDLLADLPASFCDESWKVFRDEMTTLAQGATSFQSEAPMMTQQGEQRLVSLHLAVAPGAERTLSRVLVTMLDITDRKAAERALVEAAREKDEFIAVLAHELRNPLAPVQTAAALLRARDMADPVITRCAEVIGRQCSQMARLLDDLFDASRLSRGTLTLQRGPVLLQDIVDAAVETARPQIEQRQLQFTVHTPEVPILLDADAARLTQVIGNLLNNAAKFTPPPGRISLTAGGGHDAAFVTVRDTGIGLAPEQQQRIFDLFAQVGGDRFTTPHGLGIGLALARQLVEMHGGSIAVSSDGPGTGAEFTVRLPLIAAAPAAPQDPHTSSRPSLLGRRVLVANDNTDAAGMLEAWLLAQGCEVQTVTDGADAIEATERFRPDVVLLDLATAGLGEYEAGQRIRNSPWGAGVTLVALTARDEDEDRQRTAAAGFDHHLVKPVDLDLLIALLRE